MDENTSITIQPAQDNPIQIQLTEDQVTALQALAARQQLSLDTVIRQGIDNLLRSAATPGDAEQRRRAFLVAGRFRSGLGDLSRRHDEYLAEEYHRTRSIRLVSITPRSITSNR